MPALSGRPMPNGLAFYIADPDNPDAGELVIAETADAFMIAPVTIPGPFRFVPKSEAILYRMRFDIPWFAPHLPRFSGAGDHEH